ncbi:MAG: hypothetical protein KAJ01_09775, partial [Candidatus Hydrogenedentes bacterium]|nr:hypothetical protein [Candidatus Hydrogenedentota bacterium]
CFINTVLDKQALPSLQAQGTVPIKTDRPLDLAFLICYHTAQTVEKARFSCRFQLIRREGSDESR